MKREPAEALTDLVAPQRGMTSVSAERFDALQPSSAQECCWVVQEQALRLEVAEVGDYTLMSTPTGSNEASGYLADGGVLGEATTPGSLALAAGFLFTEGIIQSLSDVASMAVCPDSTSVVRVRLFKPERVQSARRSGVVASSCGLCANVDEVPQAWANSLRVGNHLHLTPAQVHQHMLTMQQHQVIFGHTGGTHAAALFGGDGALLAAAEDLGRHNALDKVIGHCLLHEHPTAGCCVLLSGRVSLEMVIKAARAGIEVVAAVSAPSSLAIDVARETGITLCGFVRGNRLTAFTHAQRFECS